jgi:hypothetical protein
MTSKTRMIPQTIPALNIPSTTAHPDKLKVRILRADKIIVCFFMGHDFSSKQCDKLYSCKKNTGSPLLSMILLFGREKRMRKLFLRKTTGF